MSDFVDLQPAADRLSALVRGVQERIWPGRHRATFRYRDWWPTSTAWHWRSGWPPRTQAHRC